MNKQNSIDKEQDLNLILEWGKTKLLSPHLIKFCGELEKCCKPLLELGETQLCKFLSETIKELKMEIESAITSLSDIKLATSTKRNEAFWDVAKSGFEVFNEVNYLTKALHSLIHGYIDEGDYSKIVKELYAIYSRITEWMEEGNFSPLRFVVLNEMRRTRLSQIPEEERYQFPWYEIYSEYPDDTVELITKDLENYLSESWDKLKETVPPEYLCEASYELKRDDKLFSAINHKAQDAAFLTTFLEEPSSFRLVSIGHSVNENIDYPLPDIVAEIGVKKIRDKVMKETEYLSEADALLLEFLNAFCGPGLGEDERLKCLSRVEEKIDGIDTEGVSNEEDKDVLRNLQLWFRGECDDSQMANSAFKSWFDKMEKIAIEVDDESFSDHLNELLIEVPGLEDFCKGYVAQELQLESPLSMSQDEPLAPTQKIELSIKQNPIFVSLNIDRGGSSYIMPSSDSVSASDDYNKLWNHLDSVEGWYWGGACFAEGNKKEIFSIKSIANPFLGEIEGHKGYRFAVIGLSNNREDLEIFVNKLKSGSFTEKSQRTYPVDVSSNRTAEEIRDFTQNPLNIAVLLITYTYEE